MFLGSGSYSDPARGMLPSGGLAVGAWRTLEVGSGIPRSPPGSRGGGQGWNSDFGSISGAVRLRVGSQCQ